MSDSDRGNNTPLVAFSLLFFLILIGWIGFNLGANWQQSIHADDAANHHNEYADDKINRTCIGVFEGELLLECIHKAIETSREHKVAEQDLDAQQQMSRYAGFLFFLTGLTTLITGAGVYYVRDTLRATQAATAQARKGTEITEKMGNDQIAVSAASIEAAQDANKLAREQFKASQKPRLLVEAHGGWLFNRENKPFEFRPRHQRSKWRPQNWN